MTNFDALPLELWLIIVRKTIKSSDLRGRTLLDLTHISSPLRKLLVGTFDLWTDFTLSGRKASHHFAHLWIARSGDRKLNVTISLPQPMTKEAVVSRFMKCFTSAAPRIGSLAVFISQPFSLKLVNLLLKDINLPSLLDLKVDYDNDDEEWPFDRQVVLPLAGAHLRSLSITGIQTQPFHQFSLKNLTKCYFGANRTWKMMGLAISSFLSMATSLEDLDIIGETDVFYDFGDEGFDGFDFKLPSLRRLRIINAASSFVASFLIAMDAPLLEDVVLMAPYPRTHNEEGEEVFVGWLKAAFITHRKPSSALPARTLRLLEGDDQDDELKEIEDLAMFLAAIFPDIKDLKIDLELCLGLRMLGNYAGYEVLGRPIAWMSVENLELCSRFPSDEADILEDFFLFLTKVLARWREKGGTGLKQLKFAADSELLASVGKDKVDALRACVEELTITT